MLPSAGPTPRSIPRSSCPPAASASSGSPSETGHGPARCRAPAPIGARRSTRQRGPRLPENATLNRRGVRCGMRDAAARQEGDECGGGNSRCSHASNLLRQLTARITVRALSPLEPRALGVSARMRTRGSKSLAATGRRAGSSRLAGRRRTSPTHACPAYRAHPDDECAAPNRSMGLTRFR